MADKPQGLDALLDLPEGGLFDDSDPESSIIPSEERIIPKDWSKNNCKYCHGAGEVKLIDDSMQLCRCVQMRVAKKRGPRR